MPLTEQSEPYLRPILSSLTTSRRVGSEATVILPGGNRYTFNGHFAPLPNPREVSFQRGRGTVNPAPEIESPVQEMPARLPSYTKLRFGKVSLQGVGTGALDLVGEALANWAEANLYRSWEESERYTVQIHSDACTAVLTQTQEQLEACRTKVKTKTMKKTERKTAVRRTWIHGYSRVKP